MAIIAHAIQLHSERPNSDKHSDYSHLEMIDDYLRRFWISVVLTLPILLLSSLIQRLIGVGDAQNRGGTLEAIII